MDTHKVHLETLISADEKYVIKASPTSTNHTDPGYINYYTSANSAICSNYYYTIHEIKSYKERAYKTRKGAEKGIIYVKRYHQCSTLELIDAIKQYGRREAMKILLEKAKNFNDTKYTYEIITFSDMLSENNITIRKTRKDLRFLYENQCKLRALSNYV